MAVLLKNSIFFHIGRTGGYWVRDVLADLNLVEGEIGSFHATPRQVRGEEAVRSRTFRFCFVRHPLSWLRSAWVHEEYNGWRDSAFPKDVHADCFADFIEGLVQLFPEGPVSNFFNDYIECCDFVGRQEAVREDLCVALFRAKERFNVSSIIDCPNVNESKITKLSGIAVAPLFLLKKIMEVEKDFCDRFNYDDIPNSFVAKKKPRTSDIYAPFVKEQGQGFCRDVDGCSEDLIGKTIHELRQLFDRGFIDQVENELARRIGSYSFDRSFYLTRNLKISGESASRDVFDIFDLLSSHDFSEKSVIELGARDGVFSFFADLNGANKVVAVDFMASEGSKEIIAPFLNSKVEFRSGLLGEFGGDENNEYDYVFLFDKLHESKYPFFLLRRVASLLKPGGVLLISSGAFIGVEQVPLLFCPSPYMSPYGPGGTSFFNPKGLCDSLEAFGFKNVSVIKKERHGLSSGLPFEKFKFPGLSSSEDGRFSPIGRILVSAIKGGDDEMISTHSGDFEVGELISFWDLCRPLSYIDESRVEDEALIKILRRAEKRCSLLESEVRSLRFAINDREEDLLHERAELVIRGREVDEARQEIHLLKERLSTFEGKF